jgi:hypothetical protein
VKADSKAARYLDWINVSEVCSVVFILSGSVFQAKDIQPIKWEEAIARFPFLPDLVAASPNGSRSLDVHTNKWIS